MIAVRLMGGLGNQLFQFAFGKALEMVTGKELYFYHIGNVERERPLSIVKITPSIKMLTEKESSRYYLFPEGGCLARIERRLIGRIPFIGGSIHIESSLSYYSVDKDKVCYDGYWQSFKYFDEFKSIIVQNLKFKESVSIPASLETEISQIDSVSLHIRRGDYLYPNKSSIHLSLGLDYYKEAIKTITERLTNPVIYVFSDDLGWARDNLRTPDYVVVKFVEHNTEYHDIADIYLMARCKHNIIANSSFSWWGAYLNSNSEKLVIAPDKWYTGKLTFNIDDLIPQTWIRVRW
jgi:hypothetical protein